MENRKVLIIAICTLVMLPQAFVSAYAVRVHESFNKNILNEYKRLSGVLLSEPERKAFIKGAIQEDDMAYTRPLNHFYDPTTGRGLNYGGSLERNSALTWAQNPYIQGNFTIAWQKLFKDDDIKLFGNKTDYSFKRAVYEYVHGDKVRAMRALGQVEHLVEDMTSVPHTRNDAHGGSARGGDSIYEKETANKKSNVTLSAMPGKQRLSKIIKSTAQYTNSNFLSADTMFQVYSTPQEKELLRDEDYLVNGSILVVYDKQWVNKKTGIRHKITELNSQVMQSYWEHLSYKAVESGVALMDLFFREVERERQSGQLAYMNKSYNEVQSIATAISGFKGMKMLLGSSLTATEAYELNEDEWEGARRAAELYGIENFPPRPLGVKRPSENTERTLIKGQVGAALAALEQQGQLNRVAEAESERAEPVQPTPPTQEQPRQPVVQVPEPVVTPPTLEVEPEPVLVVEVAEPVVPVIPEPAPVVVTPPPAAPNPFAPGGYAFGAGGGGGGGGGSATPPPVAPPPDTTAPTITFDIAGCYKQVTTTCSTYPGTELTYSWSTTDADFAEFSINDSATTTVSTSTAGTATTTLAHSGDSQIITISAQDTTGNIATSTKTITAQVPSIVINEVAWAGTNASSTDEWFELYDNEDYAIDLTGMSFKAVNSGLIVPLTGTIGAKSYYLVESSEPATSVTADQVTQFNQELSDHDDTVQLVVGTLTIDEVTPTISGNWRGGHHNLGSPPHTMERFLPTADSNSDTNWASASMYMHPATDRVGGDIYGTPASRNSINYRFTYNNQVDVAELTIDTSRSPYVMENFVVPSGKKLTIESGVQAEFFASYHGGLDTRGELVVQGTAANPVVLKPYNDIDKWGGVSVILGGVADIAYTNIVNSGDAGGVVSGAVRVSGGIANLANVTVTGSASHGLYSVQSATTTVSHSTFSNSVDSGVYVDSGTLSISDSTLSDNGDSGLYISFGTGSVSVVDNNFDNNVQRAVSHMAETNFTYSGNSGTGNGIDGIYLDSSFLHSATTTALTYNPLPYSFSNLVISNGKTLDIDPGVTLKGTTVAHTGGKSGITVQSGGTLSVRGTVASPVTFTSLNDPDNSPAEADWWGIVTDPGSNITGASTSTAPVLYTDPVIPAPW